MIPPTRTRVYCPECKFWDGQRPNQGLCRINSPVVDGESVYGRWPVTHASDWCAEGERVSTDVDPVRPSGESITVLRLVKDRDSV